MTSVEHYRGPDDDARQWGALERTARVLANSSLVPEHFRKKPDDILLVGLVARDLGLQLTLTNLGQFYVIKNRVGLMAQLQLSLASREGHQFRWGQCDETSATVEIRRRGESLWQPFTYTIERAKRAGLLSNNVWLAHPEDMLQCRAVTRAIRRVCPEVLLGIHSAPLDDSIEVESEAIEEAPETAGELAPPPVPSSPTEGRDPVAAHRDECQKIHVASGGIPEGTWRQLWANSWREAGLPSTARELDGEQLETARRITRQYLALAALDAIGLTDKKDRHDFVSAATNGETESTKDLTAEQLQAVRAACRVEAERREAAAAPPVAEAQYSDEERPF